MDKFDQICVYSLQNSNFQSKYGTRVPVSVLTGTVRNYAGTVPTYVNMMYLLVSVPLLSTYMSAYGYVLPVYHIWCYEESVGYVFPLPTCALSTFESFLGNNL
jgi:hypothetical protein